MQVGTTKVSKIYHLQQKLKHVKQNINKWRRQIFGINFNPNKKWKWKWNLVKKTIQEGKYEE